MGMSTAGSPEINVTPLIDVMLVLLVIFILVMPIMLPQEPLALPPRSNEGSNEGPTEPPIALRLDADLSLSINDGPQFPNRELASRLRDLLPRASAVFVDSFGGVPWGMVVATVDTVRGVAEDVHRGGVTVAIRLRDE
jgi:biopolymer transport protein ExbD